jgi:pyruvate dehydrogenase E1 component alpha subunit
MAKLWSLPVVFVIENNQYAMGTSVIRSSAETELHKRGSSFEIKGIQVDGMNVLEVRDAAKKAIKHARDGKGPMILEMKTYRYRGHSMSDPAKYRTRDEVTKTRSERDPIDMVKNRLIEEGWATDDTLKSIDKEIKLVVADAAEFAQTSPEPDASELYTDVLLDA